MSGIEQGPPRREASTSKELFQQRISYSEHTNTNTNNLFPPFPLRYINIH
jgi:hypothetical protein